MLRIQPKINKDKKVENNKQELNTLVCAINSSKLELEKIEVSRSRAVKLLIEIESDVKKLQAEEVSVMKSLDESKKIQADFIQQVNQTKLEVDDLLTSKNSLLASIEELNQQLVLAKQLSSDELNQLNVLTDIKKDEIKISLEKLSNEYQLLKQQKLELDASLILSDKNHTDKLAEIIELKNTAEVLKREIEKNQLLTGNLGNDVYQKQQNVIALDKLTEDSKNNLSLAEQELQAKNAEVEFAEKELQVKKETMLSLIAREDRVNALIPKLQEVANKVGYKIEL